MRSADNAPVAAALRSWLKDTKNRRRVARLAGISKSMLYALMEETHPVPAWVLPRIFNVVPNLDALAEALGLGELGLKLVQTKAAAGLRDVRDELLDVSEALGETVAELKRSLVDGRLDDDDRRRMRARFRELIKQAEEADQALDTPPLKAVRT